MKAAHACGICGHQQASFMESVQDPITGELFEVLKCESCGLESTSPAPADMQRYYEGQYYGGRHGWTDQACVRRRLGFLHTAMGQRGTGRVLDFGCGDGAFLRVVSDAGWDAMGTERNSPVRNAKIPVYGGLDDLPVDEKVDCVTFWHTLEHVVNPKETLSKAIKRLSPQGVLLVAVPNAGGLQAKLFGRHWLHRDVPRHLHHFNNSAIHALLESEGFVVIRRWRSEWEYDWMGWAQSLLNLLLPAPNLFFDELRGISTAESRLVRYARLLSGCVATVLVSPMMLVDLFTSHGGTIILAAQRRSN